MCKTCGPVSVVTTISVDLPTYGSPPQCQNVIYAPADVGFAAPMSECYLRPCRRRVRRPIVRMLSTPLPTLGSPPQCQNVIYAPADVGFAAQCQNVIYAPVVWVHCPISTSNTNYGAIEFNDEHMSRNIKCTVLMRIRVLYIFFLIILTFILVWLLSATFRWFSAATVILFPFI